MKFHKNKTIFVDIDQTLYRDQELDRDLVKWIKFKKGGGYTFILWTARGLAYAEQFVSAFGLFDLFDYILSKPGHIIDDQGWKWTKYVSGITREHILFNLAEIQNGHEPTEPIGLTESGVDEPRDVAGKLQAPVDPN